MKRLSLIISIGTLALVMFAVGCGSNDSSTPNVDSTFVSESLPLGNGSRSGVQWLQSRSGDSTGIWVNGTGKASGEPDLAVSYTHLTLPTNREV